jgi:hypothetical protein
MEAAGEPKSGLCVYERSGHFPWIEERALFIQTAKAWLEQVEGWVYHL